MLRRPRKQDNEENYWYSRGTKSADAEHRRIPADEEETAKQWYTLRFSTQRQYGQRPCRENGRDRSWPPYRGKAY